jgi:hypothetical protein
VDCETIEVSWSDTANSGVQSYNVFRDSVWFDQVQASSRSVTDNDRSEETRHSYQVEAYDGANHSSRSSSASATTPACEAEGPPSGSRLLGSVSDSPSSFFTRGVAAEGDLAVVTGSGDGTWLKVIDVSDPSSPRRIGTLRGLEDGRDVALDGGFAFAWLQNPTGTADFVVVDLRSPTRPTVVSRIPLQGWVTAMGGGLDLVGSMAYVAATNTLQLIEVSDPFSPRVRGSVDLPGSPRDVSVMNGRAYVAAKGDVAVVDVQNAGNPVVVLSRRTNDAWAVQAVGGLVYLMNSQVLTVRRPADMVTIGGMSVGGAAGFAVQGDRAYFASRHVIVADLSDPLNGSVIEGVFTPGENSSVAVDGGLLYVGDEDSILDVIEPAP